MVEHSPQILVSEEKATTINISGWVCCHLSEHTQCMYILVSFSYCSHITDLWSSVIYIFKKFFCYYFFLGFYSYTLLSLLMCIVETY